MRQPIFVSACLLGMPCRYDGGSKPLPHLIDLINQNQVIIPFCPEIQGGLAVPRLPAEIIDGDGAMVLKGKARVINQKGDDYTEQFLNGAKAVLRMAKDSNPKLIILKSKSPSCGIEEIYDGTFSGRLRQGYGVAAALLKQAGFEVCTELDYLNGIRH
ncbi:MAG: DUF523 domain-containing protein [Bacteroidota bacterium]